MPREHVGRVVEVSAGDGKIEIFATGDVVGVHPWWRGERCRWSTTTTAVPNRALKRIVGVPPGAVKAVRIQPGRLGDQLAV